MDHAITIGMVFWAVLGIGGLIAIGAILLGLLWLMNPFRTGH